MTNLIITYSNGDVEECKLDSKRATHMLRETVNSEFKIAWTHSDKSGDYKRILNTQHVRSIEIKDDEEMGVD